MSDILKIYRSTPIANGAGPRFAARLHSSFGNPPLQQGPDFPSDVTSYTMSPMHSPRVVLDTSVIVAGLRSQLGAGHQLLKFVAEQRLTPLVTTALFFEYEDVLGRPEHRLATGMDKEDVAGFLAAFASAAEPVEVHFLWRPQLSDPADELVLEAAVNGRANAIVTHNIQDFLPVMPGFGIEVVTPGALLKRMRK